MIRPIGYFRHLRKLKAEVSTYLDYYQIRIKDMSESMGFEETDVTQEALESVEDGIIEITPQCIGKKSIVSYPLLWKIATLTGLTIGSDPLAEGK